MPVFEQEVSALVAHVKDCPPMQGFSEILVPGEPEQRTLARRSMEGVPIEEATWEKLLALANRGNVAFPAVQD